MQPHESWWGNLTAWGVVAGVAQRWGVNSLQDALTIVALSLITAAVLLLILAASHYGDAALAALTGWPPLRRGTRRTCGTRK